MFTVTFGTIPAHEGTDEREAMSWYSMLVTAAHAYGRRLELRDGEALLAYISENPARRAELDLAAVSA